MGSRPVQISHVLSSSPTATATCHQAVTQSVPKTCVRADTVASSYLGNSSQGAALDSTTALCAEHSLSSSSQNVTENSSSSRPAEDSWLAKFPEAPCSKQSASTVEDRGEHPSSIGASCKAGAPSTERLGTAGAPSTAGASSTERLGVDRKANMGIHVELHVRLGADLECGLQLGNLFKVHLSTACLACTDPSHQQISASSKWVHIQAQPAGR